MFLSPAEAFTSVPIQVAKWHPREGISYDDTVSKFDARATFSKRRGEVASALKCERIRRELRCHPLPRNFRFSRAAALRVAEGILLAPSETTAMQFMRGDIAATASLLLLWEYFEGKVKDVKLDDTEPLLTVPYYDFASWVIEAADRSEGNRMSDQLPVLDGRPTPVEV